MERNAASYGLLFADLVAIVAGFRAAYWLRYALAGIFPTLGDHSFGLYWPAILIAAGLWILLFHALQMDRFHEGLGLAVAVPRLLAAVTFLLVGVLAGSFLARIYYSRLLLLLLGGLLVVLLLSTRMLYQASLRWLRKYKVGLRRAVIVGDSELAREIGDRIRRHHELRYELLGFLSPSRGRMAESKNGQIVGGSEGMVRELLNKRVDELIFAIPIRRDTEILEFIARCQKLGIEIKLVPEYYKLHVSQLRSFSIDGIPILELKETSMGKPYEVLKLVMDYSITLCLMLALWPVLGIIAALLYWTKGRAINREVRIGQGGRPFTLYRFDVSLADSRPGSPARGTRLCRFLHRYSFSELPQLWNVLKGDMSIVGPRPETPERIRHYSAWHRRRLELKPGLTGLAQIKGVRGYDSVDEKTKYDLEYAANFSPFLDLTLTLATPGTLLRRRKAVVLPPPSSAGLRSDRTMRLS